MLVLRVGFLDRCFQGQSRSAPEEEERALFLAHAREFDGNCDGFGRVDARGEENGSGMPRRNKRVLPVHKGEVPDVIENEQPIGVCAQPLPYCSPRPSLVCDVFGQEVEVVREVDERTEERRAAVGRGPQDVRVVALKAIGILQGKRGLAHTTKAGDRLRDGQQAPWCHLTLQLLQERLPTGEEVGTLEGNIVHRRLVERYPGMGLAQEPFVLRGTPEGSDDVLKSRSVYWMVSAYPRANRVAMAAQPVGQRRLGHAAAGKNGGEGLPEGVL